MEPIRRRVLSLACAAVSLLCAACGDSDCLPPLGAGTLFPNTEVEPSFAVNPKNPSNLIGVWQQDRYSNGGARGIATYVSFDAGNTWTTTAAKFSRCTGGTYERASDPWISIAPDGTAHQLALTFDISGNGGNRGILASRSRDGGRTWSDPARLQTDTNPFFALDKGALTADPTDANLVYAVWDRLTGAATPTSPTDTGPTWLARSIDGGNTWPDAVQIYDPGPDAQTIGNIVAVLSTGTLLNAMEVIRCNSGTCPTTIEIAVLRSPDKGVTWTLPPVTVASVESVGVVDPKTTKPVRTGGSLPAIAADASTGAVHVVWQDSRFTHARDAIALSTSIDGGKTWSVPVQANRAPTAAAFTPAVSAAGGVLAVSYYDTRDDDPADTAHFLVSAWLATSPDQGTTWQERRLAGPFDLRVAPFAEGYFLGDYEGLAVDGTSFLAFFAAANSGNASDPTSILFRRIAPGTAAAKSADRNSVTPYLIRQPSAVVPLIHQVAPRSSSARAMEASTGGEKK
jgi:Neuraminidase (sialidase)